MKKILMKKLIKNTVPIRKIFINMTDIKIKILTYPETDIKIFLKKKQKKCQYYRDRNKNLSEEEKEERVSKWETII